MPEKKDLSGIGARMGQSAAGGSSGTPPAGPSAAELEKERLASQASSLGSQLGSLRSKASMADLRTSVGQLDSTLSGLPAMLAELRQGGYVYRAFLEKKVEVLRQQWTGLRQRIDTEAATQSRILLPQIDAAQARLSAMGSYLNAANLDALERDIQTLGGRVDDALRALEGTFNTIQENARQTDQQLKAIQQVLKQVGEASFRLRQGENVVEAVEAQYLTDGEKEGPKGLLFLTDQRLLFEQKEKVATKKVLFITTASELVQKLVLDLPIGSVEQCQADEKGALMFKKELLRLSLKGADVSQALLRLEADSEPWPALITRVSSGDIAGERVGGAAAAVEPPPPANVPTKCPTCGATLPELMRGQTSIKCEYCDTVIRV